MLHTVQYEYSTVLYEYPFLRVQDLEWGCQQVPDCQDNGWVPYRYEYQTS